MSESKGYEYTSLNPGWIKKKVPDSYADDDLRRIILFYVINTPCTDLSSSGIPLKEYGWGKDCWKNNKLKNRLFACANLERDKTFFVAKKTNDMKIMCEKAKVKDGFHKRREKEKVVIYKPYKYTSEFMAVLYHIRNALAHGRLAMYEIKDSLDIIFVLEDGVKDKEQFQVRSRMILRKSTLLKWIDIFENKEKKEVT